MEKERCGKFPELVAFFPPVAGRNVSPERRHTYRNNDNKAALIHDKNEAAAPLAL